MNLTGTTQSFELVTGAAVDTDWVASWSDIDKSGSTSLVPGSAQGTVSTATDTTIVASPGASIYRVITSVAIRNKSGSTQTVTIQKDVGGTEYTKIRATLLAGEALIYEDGSGWDRYNADGERLGRGAPGTDGADGAAGAPGVGTTGEVLLDFGGFPGASDASVTVTGQAGIVADSVVEAWMRLEATGDHSADEHWVETIEVFAGNIVAGVGFTIYGKNTNQLTELVDPQTRKGNVAGPGVGKNAKRPAITKGGTRLYGQFTVQWRWS